MTPESAQEAGASTWASSSFKELQGLTKGHKQWMDNLRAGDLSGILPVEEQYLTLAGQEYTDNPRGTEDF